MNRGKRYFSRLSNWIGLLLAAVYISVALAAPQLSSPPPSFNPAVDATADPNAELTLFQKSFKQVGNIFKNVPLPPNSYAPLGTTPTQYSVFHTLVWGTRDALRFGLSVTLLTMLIGVSLGAASAYRGGWVNAAMMRITDGFLTFPVLAGVVFFNQLYTSTLAGLGFNYFGSVYLPPNLADKPFVLQLFDLVDPFILAFVFFSWMPYARLVNTLVLQLKRLDFVEAARALGAGPLRIIFRHLIPNALGPILVLAARDVGGMVILQSTFTFIGIGGESPWGQLLAIGRDWIIGPGGNILAFWWLYVPGTLALVLFGIAWNLIGDGIGDLLV